MIRVVLADDHALVREGLQLLLDRQPDIEVAGHASDLDGIRSVVSAVEPDILLLDINLGPQSGLDALADLRREFPKVAVVILTMQRNAKNARTALESGAAGYVLKDAGGQELVRAIRAVAAGGTYLEPELGAELMRMRRDDDDDGPLSQRERDVLRLVALGHTSAEIGEQLFISRRTVESHRARIQEKLGVSTRAELIRYARAQGLV